MNPFPAKADRVVLISFITPPPLRGAEPLPSLGLNPPLQQRRLRVFGSISTSQVRGRRVLNKHSVDTCRCGLRCPVHRSGLVFPVTSTHFVYPARRVTQRNRIFSLVCHAARISHITARLPLLRALLNSGASVCHLCWVFPVGLTVVTNSVHL